MEHIRLTQTQTLSSTSNVAGESSDSPTLELAAIYEWVIVDEVLKIQQGHCKGIRHIIKGKKKAPNTFYSPVTYGSKQSQVDENQYQLAERVDVQQCDIEAQHHDINALRAFIT